MFEYFRAIYDPAGYHGRVLRPPFFEGWYVKLVDPAERARFAVIPGIFLSKDRSAESSHAFIQVMDGQTGKVTFVTYPVSEFHPAPRGFDLRIGSNHFSMRGVHLDIDSPELSVKGDVEFRSPPPRPWPVTTFSPGIMGPFSFTPLMECYHGVLSLDHGLKGGLAFNGVEVDFTDGRGYLEKDWGRAFPSAWVWFQSNHFQKPGTCITASIAVIPWLGTSFAGFIVGLWHADQLFVFATYNGSKVEKLELTGDRVFWTLRRGDLRLEMEAVRAAGGTLRAPTPAGMDRRIGETLDASVSLRLLNGETVLYEGTGRCAGLEAAGDLERLIRMAG